MADSYPLPALPNLRSIRVVRTDLEHELPLVDAALREAGAELLLLPGDVDDLTLAREVENAELLLMVYRTIPRAVIESARRLKGIVKYGVGIDAIDIPAARERGIPVVNVPDYGDETVAEGAFALLLALAKKHKPLMRAMDRGGWVDPGSEWLARDLAGKTVGLVGVGRIGRNLARMAGAGFRARVIGFDPGVGRESMAAAGVEKRDDLHQLLAESDFVSVHAVLTQDTRHLLDHRALACMKPTAFLVNAARGAIVDETALLEALKSGRIAGAGLDVFSQEPLRRSGHPLSELFQMDNVILSPHLTFYTHEALARLQRDALERCAELLRGDLVTVKSHDPRLRAQTQGVRFVD